MFILIGFIIVIGSVLGGYAMSSEHPNYAILLQPAELLIIFGAAAGAFVASCSGFTIKLSGKAFGRAFSNGPGKKHYLEMLALLYGLFAKMQREGIISIEKDIEDPQSSSLFSSFPLMAKDKAACYFIGDTLRVYLTTGNAGELDKLMGVDMSSSHDEEVLPAHGISHMAESLPGMGIVAAVLGVVITMGHIDAEPKVLGEHIGAALIGTFLGILLCYGFFAPIAAKLETLAHERHLFLRAIREAVAASVRGSSPIVALEYGRRAIPHSYRPTFLEMEKTLKS